MAGSCPVLRCLCLRELLSPGGEPGAAGALSNQGGKMRAVCPTTPPCGGVGGRAQAVQGMVRRPICGAERGAPSPRSQSGRVPRLPETLVQTEGWRWVLVLLPRDAPLCSSPAGAAFPTQVPFWRTGWCWVFLWAQPPSNPSEWWLHPPSPSRFGPQVTTRTA